MIYNLCFYSKRYKGATWPYNKTQLHLSNIEQLKMIDYLLKLDLYTDPFDSTLKGRTDDTLWSIQDKKYATTHYGHSYYYYDI